MNTELLLQQLKTIVQAWDIKTQRSFMNLAVLRNLIRARLMTLNAASKTDVRPQLHTKLLTMFNFTTIDSIASSIAYCNRPAAKSVYAPVDKLIQTILKPEFENTNLPTKTTARQYVDDYLQLIDQCLNYINQCPAQPNGFHVGYETLPQRVYYVELIEHDTHQFVDLIAAGVSRLDIVYTAFAYNDAHNYHQYLHRIDDHNMIGHVIAVRRKYRLPKHEQLMNQKRQIANRLKQRYGIA